MSHAQPQAEGKPRDLPRHLGRLLLAAALAALWGVFVGRLMTLAGVAFLGYGDLGPGDMRSCGAYAACYALWALRRRVAGSLLRDLATGAGSFLLFLYLIVFPIEAAFMGLFRDLPWLYADYFTLHSVSGVILFQAGKGLLTALGARSAANWVREVTSPEPEPTSTGMTRREDGTWDLD